MTDDEIRLAHEIADSEPDTEAKKALRYILDALDAARRERDEAVAELENDQAEEHQLILRQGELLTGVVNALRGDPAPLHLHSHHDAAELASKVLAERDEARKRVNDD